jgi:hypothetical protein
MGRRGVRIYAPFIAFAMAACGQSSPEIPVSEPIPTSPGSVTADDQGTAANESTITDVSAPPTTAPADPTTTMLEDLTQTEEMTFPPANPFGPIIDLLNPLAGEWTCAFRRSDPDADPAVDFALDVVATVSFSTPTSGLVNMEYDGYYLPYGDDTREPEAGTIVVPFFIDGEQLSLGADYDGYVFEGLTREMDAFFGTGDQQLNGNDYSPRAVNLDVSDGTYLMTWPNGSLRNELSCSQ